MASVGPVSGGGTSLDWALWQLLDSLLPTGGFAHSYGLESAVQAGLVGPGTKGLDRFILTSLESGGALLLPFVHAAHRMASAKDAATIADPVSVGNETGGADGAEPDGGSADSAKERMGMPGGDDLAEDGPSDGVMPGEAGGNSVGSGHVLSGKVTVNLKKDEKVVIREGRGGFASGVGGSGSSGRAMEGQVAGGVGVHERLVGLWVQLDGLLHATMTNHVARRASVSQGAALLRVAGMVYGGHAPLLGAMRTRARSKVPTHVHAHHAPVFGIVCGLLGVDGVAAQRAYLFLSLRDTLSAATRLALIGPLEAATTQHRLSRSAEAILTKSLNRPLHHIHQTAPILDLVQGAHDHLSARLFLT